MNSQTCECHSRRKHRSEEEFKSLQNRLSRIEGQVRGLRRMLEDSAYCPDILVECAAVNAAIHAVEREILSEHIRTCVVQDLRQGREDTIPELARTLQRLMK